MFDLCCPFSTYFLFWKQACEWSTHEKMNKISQPKHCCPPRRKLCIGINETLLTPETPICNFQSFFLLSNIIKSSNLFNFINKNHTFHKKDYKEVQDWCLFGTICEIHLYFGRKDLFLFSAVWYFIVQIHPQGVVLILLFMERWAVSCFWQILLWQFHARVFVNTHVPIFQA